VIIEIRKRLAILDNRFKKLDQMRTEATAEGDLDLCLKIDDEQERVHDAAERLRARLEKGVGQ